MWKLDKFMMIFFVILVIVMGYLMMKERPTTISVGRLGQSVPAFTLSDLSGKKQYTESLVKKDWTLLNVWASWCAPCKLEHPVLMAISREGYRIIGVDFKDKGTDAQRFLKQRGNPYAVVLADKDGKLGFDLGVYGVPETLLIDNEGIVRYRYAGQFTEEIFKAHFLPLMQED